MRAIITGAAGFVGSNLTDKLLADGHTVRGIDNLSTGRLEFLESARQSKMFELVEADLLDAKKIEPLFDGFDAVFHLAANADVRFGPDHPRRDLEQNTICTANVLEAVRINKVGRIAFSSTGSVYGEPTVFPTPEDAPFPVQTSLYGASKLAAEGLIAAYCEAFGIKGFIFRFVSILGNRYSHGHVVDFYNQLKTNPAQLRVLGDGTQRKSYLAVSDCVDAVLLAMEKSVDSVQIFNLGTDEYCTVSDSIGWICQHLGLRPEMQFTGGNRGWIGDNPFIFLDCARIKALGWKPKLSIREGVLSTLRYLDSARGPS
jgi:UDP-glucose 4-epimerase